MKKQTNRGFTLVELLMVIAIIGLLASILIPTVATVRENATIAAGKSQLSQYVNAVMQFKNEYGYYPFARGTKDYVINLSEPTISRAFIEIMSGRDAETGSSKGVGGNRRRIAFHDFSESEFYVGDDDLPVFTQLADGFNNFNIYIMIDGNGDGFIDPQPTLSYPAKPDQKIRSTITAWVESGNLDMYPAYTLWEE